MESGAGGAVALEWLYRQSRQGTGTAQRRSRWREAPPQRLPQHAWQGLQPECRGKARPDRTSERQLAQQRPHDRASRSGVPRKGARCIGALNGVFAEAFGVLVTHVVEEEAPLMSGVAPCRARMSHGAPSMTTLVRPRPGSDAVDYADGHFLRAYRRPACDGTELPISGHGAAHQYARDVVRKGWWWLRDRRIADTAQEGFRPLAERPE